MAPRYATYDSTTATASGRWSRRHKFSNYLVWSPDPALYTGARPVIYFKHGGARMQPNDLGLGSSTIATMCTDELGAFVVSYDCNPGGFYVAGGQEPDAEFFPESIESDIAALSWFNSRPTDTALWGATGSISTNWLLRAHWGSSSGGYDVAHAQLTPDGDVDYGEVATLRRGEAAYAVGASHRCGCVIVNQAQLMLSSFTAQRGGVAHGYDVYTVSGAHSVGASTLAVATGTGAIYKGNALVIGSKKYVATADRATPGTGGNAIPIYPTIEEDLTGGETVTVELGTDGSDLSKYWPYAWCGGYLYRIGTGYTWDTFPMARKQQADATRLARSDNPRALEATWVLIGGSGNELITSSVNAGDPKSFLNHMTSGVQDPAYSDLHSEHQSFAMAHLLDAAGNTTKVHLYQGNTTSNPGPYSGSGGPAWNKGTNALFSEELTATTIEVVGSGSNIYRKASGTWSSDFAVGRSVWVDGYATAANNGAKTITGNSGTDLTVQQSLTTEAAGASATFRWIALKAILQGLGW